MRILCVIVQIPMLPTFHTGQHLALGGAVALELIRDDDPRDIGQALEELAGELLRSLLAPPALYQEVEHVAVLIHRSP